MATPATGVILDFHNHLMPAVDDGAQSPEESASGLHAMMQQGVSTIITTPHFSATTTVKRESLEERLDELDAAWAQLLAVARREDGEIELKRGVELRLDTPEPDLTDPRLRLSGTDFVLLEFPAFQVPPRSREVFTRIRSSGYRPVLAHPERYDGIGDLERVRGWRQAGAFLQMNAGSVVGEYGESVRRLALQLLQRGLVDYLSSDYHARGQPAIAACRAAFGEVDAVEQFDLLTTTNPRRLLEGSAPLPVPPLQMNGSFWAGVAGRFRRIFGA